MISLNEKEFLLNSLLQDLRMDGRQLIDNREISIVFPGNLGVVELHLGKTKVFTKVIGEIVEPRQDRPSEGFLKFQIDLSQTNDQIQMGKYNFKKYQTEIQKIIEKIIIGSRVIDVESLCLLSGKRVWQILVQSTLLNNDGNLIDAFYLSAILGLLNFRKPQVNIESNGKISLYDTKVKLPQPLCINHIPLIFTYGLFHNSKVVVADPVNNEELVMEGRISIATNIYNDICLIHKPGGAPIDLQTESQLIEVTKIKVGELTKFIRTILQNTKKHGIGKLRENLIQFNWTELNYSDQMIKSQGFKQNEQIEVEEKQDQFIQELKDNIAKIL